MTTLFEITHRHTGSILYSGGERLRDVVVSAVKGGADLRGADLRSADLRRADLRSADLRSADLRSAYLRSAYLRGAYLFGAYLGGAYLRGADLGGADLRSAKLIGDRPILQIGPIGSRSDYLIAFVTDQGVLVRAGCFFGSLDELSAAIDKTHGDSVHGIEYATAIAMIDAHAELWTPAAIVEKEMRK